MKQIFGFDIGTTSIGFAVVRHESEAGCGEIVQLGVRVFPEARDPDGTPLNQQRRQKRMMRRQLRRRRLRRRLLNQVLAAVGLLPAFGSPEWAATMNGENPYFLRRHGLSEELSPYQLGRILYHLAKRRHFLGRDLEESSDDGREGTEDSADEKQALSNRESTLSALKAEGITLGAWLAAKPADAVRGQPPRERRRGIHAHRSVVKAEFEELWQAQAPYHPILLDESFKAEIHDAIFTQRPVFWRTNTLGSCRFMPGEELCPKGSWLSQQRRMLEKLNNLALAGGNQRPLDEAERAAILSGLQTQASMSWPGVRSALKPLYKARGEAGAEKTLKFNLELGGERKLSGNAVEARLARIFGDGWAGHPHRQAIRDAVQQRVWAADYGGIGSQRVVIRPPAECRERRLAAAQSFIRDFAVTPEQAAGLSDLSFPSGWEPFSTRALEAFLPHLAAGVRFGELVSGPKWEDWRNECFPKRHQPTGEFLDRLPSPACEDERKRLAGIRNPTVVRVQNELRKVVNNLIGLYGKPDHIRVEVAREVGLSKREREEKQSANRKQEALRKAAARDLIANNIADPSRDDVEKWLLWQESQKRCPYTGDLIGFDALFRENQYEVEHIWPRSISFDDSFRNKTLCRKDVNAEKGNRIPFQAFSHDPERWEGIKGRLDGLVARQGKSGMVSGKVKRFLAESIPEDFASRQLNDTGYAARQALAFLKRLWPDLGPTAPVHVDAVTGRVTAQVRKLWTLNNIGQPGLGPADLGPARQEGQDVAIPSPDGQKTRADHRHHAIDALAVACTDAGMTQRLSRYWQAKENPNAPKPHLPPPWPTIRADAERAVAKITVSHRVRKKVSGPLHKETTYGDTGQDFGTASGSYRQFVTRKKVEALTKSELASCPERDGEGIRDGAVRGILRAWVATHGGDPKKAFPTYPRLGENGPEIRKVRLLVKQQLRLMAPVATGYADLGSNHHIAIYRRPDGKAEFDVVSLFEASRRLAKREPVVRRDREDGAVFVMSLTPGDALEFPDGKKKGLWVVTGFWASGQIVLEHHTDAGHATTTRPNPDSVLREGARKVSIDPIGRIRPAND